MNLYYIESRTWGSEYVAAMTMKAAIKRWREAAIKEIDEFWRGPDCKGEDDGNRPDEPDSVKCMGEVLIP